MLYTEYERQWTSGDERVMVQSLTPGAAPKLLLSEAADARYLSSGHLAFLRQGTLFVVPFDAQTLELRGEPVADGERRGADGRRLGQRRPHARGTVRDFAAGHAGLRQKSADLISRTGN